jgi:hypothetical protein
MSCREVRGVQGFMELHRSCAFDKLLFSLRVWASSIHVFQKTTKCPISVVNSQFFQLLVLIHNLVVFVFIREEDSM